MAHDSPFGMSSSREDVPQRGVGCPSCLSSTTVIPESYEGGRSSSNLMDRRVLLLLRPFCALEFEPDRATPLFERSVLDRLTSPAVPLLFELTVLDRLTLFLSCVERAVPLFSSCVERRVPLLPRPAGCSNEKAVLLRLCFDGAA